MKPYSPDRSMKWYLGSGLKDAVAKNASSSVENTVIRPMYGPLRFSSLILFKDLILFFDTAEAKTSNRKINTITKHGLTRVADMVKFSSKKILYISSVSQRMPASFVDLNIMMTPL